ncbi:MAG: integrase [Nitrososphaeraceae archaeon]
MFTEWLQAQGKTKATVKETVNYAKLYCSVLETGDASVLVTLSPANKRHAMSALANWAKFVGKYELWLQIRHNHSLKWSKGDSMKVFERFFNPGLTLEAMLQRIRKMIEKTPPSIGKILRFAVLTGLRPSEAVESVRLLNDSGNMKIHESGNYYNPETQALEHFRYPDIFLRQTKKAYLSFIRPENVHNMKFHNMQVPSYNDIRLACYYHAGINCDMRFCRKVFASYLSHKGIQSELIDVLQGRVPHSVFARHYLVPEDSLTHKILSAVTELSDRLN